MNHLVEGAQGMFRWVSMSLETLRPIKHIKDFEEALGKLPPRLSDLYEEIHRQIDQVGRRGREVAIKTLKWLLCAQRLLSVAEILAAVEETDSEISSDSDDLIGFETSSDSEDYLIRLENVPSSADGVLDLCRNLVVLDSEQDIFRFAHQSVRDWLLSRQDYSIKEQHADAAERSLDVYVADPNRKSENPRWMQQDKVFKPYASVYWPIHFGYVQDCQSERLKRKMLQFLKQGSCTSTSYQQWASDIVLLYNPSRQVGDTAQRVNRSQGLADNDPLGLRLTSALSYPPTYLCAVCAIGLASLLRNNELSFADLDRSQDVVETSVTLLGIAAQEGHYEIMQILLEKGANVHAKDYCYTSPLHTASLHGQYDIVLLLLMKGADVNAKDIYNTSALNMTSTQGYYDIALLLLNSGADVNARGKFEGTALQVASKRGSNEIVQLLLDRGADVNTQGGRHGTALQIASSHGHCQIVRMLLNKEANVNFQGGEYGTALQAASEFGFSGIVKLLLDKGADIDARGRRFHETALQIASRCGRNEVVQILLDNGADVNIQGYGTALQVASTGGNFQIVRMLLSKGANLNAEEKWFGTAGECGSALYRASYCGHSDIVQLLLKFGADINARGGRCGSALNAASYEEIEQLLISSGAVTDPMDSQISLHNASEDGFDQTILMLLDQGVDVNCQDEYGRTALEDALEFDQQEVVKLLIEKGARINLLPEWGSDVVHRIFMEDRNMNCADFISANSSSGEKSESESEFEDHFDIEEASYVEKPSGDALDLVFDSDDTREPSTKRRRLDDLRDEWVWQDGS